FVGRRHPGLLDRERVDRALARQVDPRELVGCALAAETARRPSRAPAARARGGDQPSLPQSLVELVELVLLRRLERQRVRRAEVTHDRPRPPWTAIMPGRARIRPPRA